MVVSTVVIAVATILYCAFSGWMAWEMRSARMEQSKPHVVVYPRRRPNDWHQLEVVIENVGGGTAFDVKFTVSSEFLVRGWTQQGGGLPRMDSGPLVAGIPAMSSGRVEVVWWGIARVLWSALHGKVGSVTIDFAGRPNGKRESVVIPLSIDEIDTDTAEGDSVLKELKAIAGTLNDVSRSGLRLKDPVRRTARPTSDELPE